MKRVISIAVIVVMLVSIFSVLPASATEDFQYVRLTAEGNDPYGPLVLSDIINPDEVKYAAIKYRTISQYDNTNVELIGQFYITPAAEPFIPIIWKHTQQWETIIVDMTSVSAKTALESKWNSANFAGDSIRFDPLESNRDAEAADNENDEAVVSEGDCIDIAFIAFFESEADAKAYTGVEDTPAAIISLDDLEYITENNVYGELRGGSAATAAPATQAPATQAPETDAPATGAPATDAPSTGAPSTDAPSTDAPGTSDPSTDPADDGGFPIWAWIVIGVAVVVLVVVIVAAAAKKKK